MRPRRQGTFRSAVLTYMVTQALPANGWMRVARLGSGPIDLMQFGAGIGADKLL